MLRTMIVNQLLKYLCIISLSLISSNILLGALPAKSQELPEEIKRLGDPSKIEGHPRFDFKAALPVYKKHLEFYRRTNNIQMKGETLLALGNLHNRLAMLNGRSWKEYTKSKKRSEKLSEEQIYHYSKALNLLEEAYDLSLSNKDDWLEIRSVVSLAMLDSDFLVERGLFKTYANRALALMKSHTIPRLSSTQKFPDSPKELLNRSGYPVSDNTSDADFLDESTEFHKSISDEYGSASAQFFDTFVASRVSAYKTALRTFTFASLDELYRLESVLLGHAISSSISDLDKLKYLDNFEYSSSAIISYDQHQNHQDPEAPELALNSILERRFILTDALRKDKITLSERQNNLKLQNQIQKQSNSLFFNYGSNIILPRLCSNAHPNLDSPEDIIQIEYSCFIKDRRRDGQKIYFVTSMRPTDIREQFRSDETIQAKETLIPGKYNEAWKTVQKHIPSRSALIEYVKYRPYDPSKADISQRWGPPRYAAYLLLDKGQSRSFDLGPINRIDDLVNQYRSAMSNDSTSLAQVQQIGKQLEAMLTRPIRQHLGGARTLFVVPEAQLNLLPFSALVDENGQYLVEDYSITYLTTGRDLIDIKRLRKLKAANQSLIVADPDFAYHRPSDEGRQSRSVDLLECCDRLEWTEREAQELQQLLPNAEVLTQQAATKAAVIHVQSPKILHLATHGFFLEDQVPSLYAQAVVDETQAIDLENPLLRSGLAFTGFDPKTKQFGGALTALEVSRMNLLGTRLVVLSACQTGVGKVTNGDGVHGLRRSFFIAGAQSLVMSLWNVDDRGTYALMRGYYSQLLREGAGRREALRKTQLTMLKTETYRHPHYWAGFFQSGDWKPL